MKKAIVFLIVCLLLVPYLAAAADIIWLPENDFFSKHSGDCVFLGRSFIANGAGGSVPVMDAPGSGKKIHTVKNGEYVYIEYSCRYDDELWGLVPTDQYTDSGYKCGWAKMDQFLVVYDYVSFHEEHLLEFHEPTGNYDALRTAGGAVIWPWPGAGKYLWTTTDLDVENFYVIHAYTDPEGREWGFVNYLYGQDNVWICLSDPLNTDIPAFNPATDPTKWESETEHKNIGKTDNNATWWIIALVAAVVIAAAVLIGVLWKPGKKKG